MSAGPVREEDTAGAATQISPSLASEFDKSSGDTLTLLEVETGASSTTCKQSDWFYNADSWTIIDSVCFVYQMELFDLPALRQYMKTVQDWLRKWSTTGSCPFIHHCLYSQRFPDCMQDAYMALAAYLARTPENSQMCFRIIRDRAEKLIDQSSLSESSIEATSGIAISSLDPFDHLARVQALLIYQVIGYFDGDITLRGMAERHAPKVLHWTNEMWKCIKLESSLYSTAHSVGTDSDDSLVAANNAGLESMDWRHWIVCESIRRTWIVATTTQSIYEGLKDNWSACLGGGKFTPRAGAWDAVDAYSWGQRVAPSSVPLLTSNVTADVLFETARPEDVDDFSHAILGSCYGSEKVARWKAAAAKE
ncbi:uncharacterized protein JN550_009016 [Neoarthrinium moseri]|uniref:uncharacterized protein n=1 Tax=Neoarthrinium moseri TaxID=1658444 RepID=UPI001FDD394B|nr:uncharacterized protein JN550_009016 [Neoarthrinium moseri]KAI1864459.1 hypothetical protein JN550_009016 [Neoarthrinium moseri]